MNTSSTLYKYEKTIFVPLALALVLLINLTGLVSANGDDSGCDMMGMMFGSFGIGRRIFS